MTVASLLWYLFMSTSRLYGLATISEYSVALSRVDTRQGASYHSEIRRNVDFQRLSYQISPSQGTSNPATIIY